MKTDRASISLAGSHVFIREKFAGGEGGGEAVFDAQLFEDDGEVFLYRVFGKAEDLADFGVRFSHAEPEKNADFARGERRAEAAGVSMTQICLVVLLT